MIAYEVKSSLPNVQCASTPSGPDSMDIGRVVRVNCWVGSEGGEHIIHSSL